MTDDIFVTAREVTSPGIYKVDMCDGTGVWEGVEVYPRKGLLYLDNPENGKESCLKSIIGWRFLKMNSDGVYMAHKIDEARDKS